ncbi:MAG TPA: carbon-nitrogen hydrolase family protein [Gammaproteobacteria bacterium]
MSRPFTVACVQNRATSSMRESMAECESLCREAAAKGAQLICLPEYCSCLSLSADRRMELGAHEASSHPALAAFSNLAQELNAWMVIGSLAVKTVGGLVCNRSYVLDARGSVVAEYDKIHLFDVDLANGESYRESDSIVPGDRAVIVSTPWGALGLSVCYDLRFPQLYRALAQAGAEFITVPAAFTRTTGEVHWHVLNRSRAIETGCFVLAPCQYGTHGIAETYGHSLIIDPWGAVLADGGEDAGVILAEVDPAAVAKARAMIPSLEHDRTINVNGVRLH